ncbi:hypothetical protein PIB30_094908 [Stylosanthes scabra]|uniref:Putative plant transposon protein domain-containing protein n=1 Tax=Stylosanthes scabra TaxID=79078 RepID=A0ABU6ZU79_9FABA|nr:hypothetical protein [Stylosanthes scabra]
MGPHRDRRPHYLRRSDLEPMPKGWYEFVCQSILPTTNRSELTIERAMLIHSIIIGENINVEEIIAEQIYKKLDQHQEENRRSFEAINTRMNQMDDQLSFLCISNQMADEQMLFPYRNTTKQFKEMEIKEFQ